jgi:sulfate-transporting ATPase
LAVDEFRLTQHTESQPSGLPFGTRRLAGIARSVARSPSILLLDEPGAGLDETEIRELTSVIRRLAGEWGIAVLLVEHHLDMVAAACDHVVVLDHGQLLAAGTPKEMLADPRVRRAYVGDATHMSGPRTGVTATNSDVHAGRAHQPMSS